MKYLRRLFRGLFTLALFLLALPAAAQPSITFSMEGGRITQSEGATYYEFDVMASVADTAQLGNTQIYLNYTETAFGPRIGKNGKITVTRGSLISQPLIYDLSFSDNLTEGTNKVSIFTEYKQADEPSHGTPIGFTPAPLYHVRIALPDTLKAFTIEFDNDCAAGPCMVGEQFRSDGEPFKSVTAAGSLQYAPVLTNVAPTAAPDVATTSRDTPVNVYVLTNDVDPNGDSLRIVGIGPAQHGGTSQPEPGIIRYIPAAGFTGSDTFIYTIGDGREGVSEAKVTIIVLAFNAPPQFPGGAVFVTPVDGSVVSIADADVDPSATFTASWHAAEDPEGSQVTYRWQLSESATFNTILAEADAGTQTSVSIPLSVLAGKMTELAISEAKPYYHRLIASDGSSEAISPTESVTFVRGAVTSAGRDGVPQEFALAQNYPNPFNPSTTIGYTLPQAAHVTLRVYNALGAEVGTFVDRRQTAGFHEVGIDAGRLPSGVYMYRLDAGEFAAVRSMILMK